MTENELFSNQGNSLHRHAAEKAARMIDTQEALSPKETRQTLHELRVHQIELEMQNEELRRAQADLRAARARYLDLYDLAPVGYVTLSEAGLILEANLTVAAMLGVERNALLRKRISQFIFSEDQDVYSLRRKQAIETGDLQAWEMRLMQADGSEFWAHLQFIPASNGECLFTLNDVTERKLAETEIQDAREYAENIVETVREPLLVLNPDLKILTANHSFYDTFKVTPEETIGNFIYDLGNRQWDIPKLRVLFEEILPHDTVFNGYEVEHDFLNIGRKIILLNARQIFRKNIGSHIILLAMEDITERKLAEAQINQLHTDMEQRVIERTAQLKGANQEMESFAYSVSHDLRAPLRSIDGFSLALLEDYGEILDDEGKDYLRRVRAATQRMAQLIDDMLKLSRITRSELIFETVDLSAIVDSIAAELRSSDPERKVEFVITKGVTAKGDPRLLRVMLGNLIGNAWKFTGGHAKARIEFGVADADGKSAFFVRDDGAGFDMKYAEKLFTTFQRLHTEREFPGTGVGLSLVRHIIHRHGGTIWAEGVVEQGATFYFTL